MNSLVAHSNRRSAAVSALADTPSIYDQNPQAMGVNGGHNYIRGIALKNPKFSGYMQAANNYLTGSGG